MELYIHIPFCVKKCLYCDFLSFPSGEETRELYVKKLLEEIQASGSWFREREESGEKEKRRRVTSIFIGGGTPSLLKPEQITSIMEAVRSRFLLDENAEITIEANPGTVDREKLASCKEAGINRLSLGLQSADDRELLALGRIHTYRDFEESFLLARESGFSNINIDLMSALPGQTPASYQDTLKKAAAFVPEHISAYSLIIEEGTPFYGRYAQMEAEIEKYGEPLKTRENEKLPPLPGEEADRAMYHFTRQFLRERGLARYEISNYAVPGKECAHNTGYWTGTDYLGLGLGAASCMEGERFSNERELKNYLAFSGEDFQMRKNHRERHCLPGKERMEEFMFLGLRLARGVGESEFLRRFGASMNSVYGKALKRCEAEGLMERYKNQEYFWRLTERGMDVSNYVLCRFLLDEF